MRYETVDYDWFSRDCVKPLDGAASLRNVTACGARDAVFGSGNGKTYFNISAICPRKQTNNRAELAAIILAVRKAMA